MLIPFAGSDAGIEGDDPELTQLTAAIDRAECLLGTAAAGVRVWESIEVRSRLLT